MEPSVEYNHLREPVVSEVVASGRKGNHFVRRSKMERRRFLGCFLNHHLFINNCVYE